jgi:purine nucleoside permease
MPFPKMLYVAATAAVSLMIGAGSPALADEPIKVKVFIGAMFEIGQNTGDRAGEFQHWYERYFAQAKPLPVKGALNPVYCNDDGICGSVLGMGKVASSSSVQAIILSPQFDMSETYFVVSGVAGTPPERGTIADVSWATWLVDYDLGRRWAPEEGEPGARPSCRARATRRSGCSSSIPISSAGRCS